MRRTSRRSSILKPPRGSLRGPELDGLPLDDDEGYTQPSSRRVSFSRISQVQEFDPTVGNLAQWKYEETVNIEEGEDIKAKSVSVYEESMKLPSSGQNRRRRSMQSGPKNDYGSDLSEFCRDLDVTMSVDNSVISMNKTTDIYNCSMRDWDVKSTTSEVVDMHLSAVDEKKRMYALIESPTKTDPKRLKVKNTTQVQFDKTFSTEMDMTFTLGGIMDSESKPDISGFGMDLTESIGKILSGKVIKGQENDSLDFSPRENVQSDENDSILSKLNCLGIGTPLSTTKEQTLSKGHPVFTVKDANMKKPGNENLICESGEMEFTKTRGKFEIQSMPSKVSVYEENSMHKENIHPEILMRKGQKINRDLFLGECSIRESSVLQSKGDNTWEGKLKTPKSSGQIDYSVQGESVACAEGMEFTVPLGQLLPMKLEKTVESETSLANASKNPALTHSSKAYNVPNLLQDQSSMYLVPRGRKSISMLESSDETFDAVQYENAYPGNIQDNKYRENPESDVNDMSGLEFTVPLGKLILHSVSECADEQISAGGANQSIHKNVKILTDSVHQSNINSSKNTVHLNDEGPINLNENDSKLDETFPGNEGMEFTVPLGKLLQLKPHQVNESAKQYEETQHEMGGMDITAPHGNVMQMKPHQGNESVKQLEVTRQEMGNMDFTVAHGNLIQMKPHQGNESVKQLEVTQQEMGNMDFTVAHGNIMQMKPHQGNESVKQLEVTQQEMGNMDFTVAYGNIMQMKPRQGNESVKQLEVTQQEMGNMDFTIAHGNVMQMKPHRVNESGKQFEETQHEMGGMDITAPHGNVMQMKPHRVNESAKQFEETQHEMGGMDITAPHGNAMQMKPHRVNESIKRFEEMQHEMSGMDFTVPHGNLMQLKPHQVNESAKQLEKTHQEMDGMDLTISHGKLLQLKPVEANESLEPLEVSIQQMEGMELTVPLGKLVDLATDNASRSTPKLEETGPKFEVLEVGVPGEELLQVKPEAAVTRDTSNVEVESNNVTLSRGSSFRKSTYFCSEFDVSRRREESMRNVSALENGKGGNGQMFSFRNDTLCEAHEMETSISYQMGKSAVNASSANDCSRNGSPEKIVPLGKGDENSNCSTLNSKYPSVVEPFVSSSKLQVIVENSVGSEIYGNSSNMQMDVSIKSSSLQNPVCSEPGLSDTNLNSANPSSAIEQKSSSIDEKEGISERSIHDESRRLEQVEESVSFKENLLVTEVKMEDESQCGDSSVMDSINNESRGSKRENPFKYSMSNFKRGAMGSLSTIASVSEEESVSESVEIRSKTLEYLGVSEKVAGLIDVEERTHDENDVMIAEETDENKYVESQAKIGDIHGNILVLEDSGSQQQISRQSNEEEEAVEKRESLPGSELNPIPLSEKATADLSAANEDPIEGSDKTSNQCDENQAKTLEDLVSEQQVCSQIIEEEAVEKRKCLLGSELSPIPLPNKNMAVLPAANEDPTESSENISEYIDKNQAKEGKSLIVSELSPIPKEESGVFQEANEDPVESSERTLEQSLLSSTLMTKEFDLEEWMKEESSKKWSPWRIRKLEDTEWSFFVMYGTVKLTIKLKPISDLPSDATCRSVDRMELVSLLDVGNRDCDYLVVNMFLERCSPAILESLCQTTDKLPELFAFMCKEMKDLDELHRQTKKLSTYYPVIFKDNSFMFSFGSRILMKLFYVRVDLSLWKDGCIEANSVKVTNKIGHMREKDIQDILKTVKKDNNYLPRFYDEVKSFIKMLEDLED